MIINLIVKIAVMPLYTYGTAYRAAEFVMIAGLSALEERG